MPMDTLQTLVEELRRYGLLTPAQWEQLEAGLRLQTPSPQALAGELVRRDWLTPFQVNRLLQGRGRELVLGPYCLLERLGEGGMGQVFKARHQLMNRVVALKIIHPDRFHPAAVQRFQREIQALAQLAHPNIVTAHDAARAGDTYFYVMEYVAGTDLAKLVKQRGALPVAEACNYAHQAAQGLQHAHEHGLVHRDVKPANLVVSSRGVLKLLDLGLARLHGGASDPPPSGELTQAGTTMGTPDYMAPEQADDFHRADIRADLYSLGCTLYYLLTARPPFPGPSAREKAEQHRAATAVPVESLRPEVPAALAAVVRQLMAKDPKGRYQTPAEALAALAPFAATHPVAVPVPAPDTESWAGRTAVQAATSGTPTAGLPRTNWRPWLWVGGVAGVLLLAAGLTLVLWPTANRDREEKDKRAAADRRTPPKDGDEPASTDKPHQTKRRRDKQEKGNKRPAGRDKKMPRKIKPAPEKESPTGEIYTLAGHSLDVYTVAFSPDGKRALSCGPREVLLWDLDKGKQLRQVGDNFSLGVVVCGAFSSDGQRALFGSRFGKVILWDLKKDKVIRSFPAKPQPLGGVRGVRGVAFAPGDRRGLSWGDDSVARLWDLKTGEELYAFEGDVACFSEDGSRILAAKGDLVTFYTVDARAGRVKRLRRFERKHTGVIQCVALSPDGKHALSGGSDRLVHMWDVDTGKEVRTFRGHTNRVNGVAFSPRGRRALSCSGLYNDADNTVRLWKVKTGKQLACFTEHTAVVNSVAFSPGGRRALSASGDKTVRLWGLPK
jgi:serine/threonine-protein kinase